MVEKGKTGSQNGFPEQEEDVGESMQSRSRVRVREVNDSGTIPRARSPPAAWRPLGDLASVSLWNTLECRTELSTPNQAVSR